jgi:hypothetical protein
MDSLAHKHKSEKKKLYISGPEWEGMRRRLEDKDDPDAKLIKNLVSAIKKLESKYP